MRWTPGGQSDDVEDRRGESAGNDGLGSGGGGFPSGGFPRGGGGGGIPIRLGLGGTLVVLALSAFFGRDFLSMINGNGDVPSSVPSDNSPVPVDPRLSHGVNGRSSGIEPSADPERQLVEFVSFVLDDVQKTWTTQLPADTNHQYTHAKLVLFTDSVRSGCGFAESAMGPFYCPVDRRVYIDLGFYRELRTRFGAPGDFAQAYVIAHEVGHHVQNLLGISDAVQRQREENPREANALSVRLELQADCYAGVWARSTDQRKLLESGDIEEGIGAAAAVGDDRLQKEATGHVNPERWTHGSSADRVAWFKRGFQGAHIAACDTFAAR